MNLPQTDRKRIVIIGGGFGGIYLAKALQNSDFQIVMVDRQNYHAFQPLLYQVSTAGLEPDSIAYPIRKILKRHKNFHFRMATVSSIVPDMNQIETNIGPIAYDYLVIATGTRTNYFGNKSVQENSMPMKTVPQALNIRSLTLQNFERADLSENDEERRALLNFSIVGGGPTGVELAGAFAELKKHVFPKDYRHLDIEEMEIHLFEGSDRLLASMSEVASQRSLEFLEKLGVHVHLKTLVKDYDGELLITNNGDNIRTKNFIWTAGVTGASIPGIGKDAIHERLNRYHVNRFNQVQGFQDIFAIGDVAYMETELFPHGHPQVAQPAIQQGKHLAANIRAFEKGMKMKPFEYKDKGSMATIGRNKAVCDLPKWSFAGFFAWFIWMFVHLMSLVGFRNRVIVFFNWAYNYINYDKAARLIVRPFKMKP